MFIGLHPCNLRAEGTQDVESIVKLTRNILHSFRLDRMKIGHGEEVLILDE